MPEQDVKIVLYKEIKEMNQINFGSAEMLLVRLSSIIKQDKKINVLVGSGLTVSNLANSERGVSSIGEIISDIQNIFECNDAGSLLQERLKNEFSEFEKYQAAMQTLLSCFGQDELNKVIVKAVLNAMIGNPVVTSDKQEINHILLEKNPQNWFLRKGVDALGEIFVDFREIFSGPILTSNFDPLLEISIRKHEGTPNSICIVNDGKFLNQISDSNSVVHFHGFWHGSDTLHTTDQLKRERPQLKGDLKKVLSNAVLIVTGYGGWNDVFTNTLVELINEGNNNFEVLWCFYEGDHDLIQEKNKALISSMIGSVGQRVVFYAGVDCHKLFPVFLEKLNTGNSMDSGGPELISSKQISAEEAFPCDTPPNNLFWVGREIQLKQLQYDDFKVCFVTGIGGQGKSGLASHFVQSTIKNTTEYEFWDWRDCKEEDNKFQTIIVSQIERLSKGKYRASKLNSEKIEDMVDLLFDVLGKRSVVFVYDNVDRYIDLADFRPVSGLAKLCDNATKLSHNSKFILTCRPRIEMLANDSIEIRLTELTLKDTIDLFTNYKPLIKQIVLEELATEAHKLTNGHALWLNLFAAQAKRGLDVVNSFLHSYMMNQNSPAVASMTIAENTLNIVWKSLNQKQQTLLRGMAEMVTSFDRDELERIFAPELGSNNQFNKALNALNSLNLLVTKSSRGKKDLFELHPLVKEYILGKYKKNDRSKFIMLIVQFYDQLILFIKPKLDSNSPLSYFEKYTQKAELQIHDHDFKGSLASFAEISNVIRAAGYSEEYLRVGVLLFDNIDWLKAMTEEYTFFHDQVHNFINCLIDRGKFDDVDNYLNKYFEVIPGKGIHYLTYCNLTAYYHWFKEDLKNAILWAEKGVALQHETGVGEAIDLKHKLALALRDTKLAENVDRALNIFLAGESIQDVLSDNFSSQNFPSIYFGNIGRCLWFKQLVNEALKCYLKSFLLLHSEKDTNTTLNIGYASLWIAEVMFQKLEIIHGLYFLKYCIINWEKGAPIRALNVQREFYDKLNSEEGIQLLSTNSSWEIEKFCREFINK